jgi:nucleoside permease NupC
MQKVVEIIAIIAVINAGMGVVHNALSNWLEFSYFPQELKTFFGWIFSPLAWLMGVP